jgi:uncharacterized protein YndB with AHSA1/START domain
MQGELVQQGGRWQLRFTRTLPHPQDKVWRAITEPEHLQAWFPDRVVGEWRVGAPLKFLSEYGDHDGQVIAYEPPRLLEFRWGPDVIRLELAGDARGSTLTLIDTIDELGKAARDAAGWDECLLRLDHHLAGTTAPAPGERWKQVHPDYIEQFGREASTIGPPAQVRK